MSARPDLTRARWVLVTCGPFLLRRALSFDLHFRFAECREHLTFTTPNLPLILTLLAITPPAAFAVFAPFAPFAPFCPLWPPRRPVVLALRATLS